MKDLKFKTGDHVTVPGVVGTGEVVGVRQGPGDTPNTYSVKYVVQKGEPGETGTFVHNHVEENGIAIAKE